MGFPTFSDAAETASQAADVVKQQGRTLIPWLPDPPTCDDCGVMMHASSTFDPAQALYVNSWHCRACDIHTYREEPIPELDRDPEPPRRGAPGLREVFNNQ